LTKKDPCREHGSIHSIAEAYEALPILNILVLHTGQLPCDAGRPFFIVICCGFCISRLVLHFIQ